MHHRFPCMTSLFHLIRVLPFSHLFLIFAPYTVIAQSEANTLERTYWCRGSRWCCNIECCLAIVRLAVHRNTVNTCANS